MGEPRRIISGVCCGVAVVTAVLGAQQRRPAGAQKPTVGVTIALKGATSYDFSGQGSCTHAPVGSIYNVVAEQWTVEQADGSRSVHLTLWRPKNGSGDMFTLSVSSGGGRPQSVNTVKAPGAPPAEGSGKVTLAPAGKGGTFTVDAKTASGGALAGSIKCDAFTPAIAEGGD